MPLCNSYTLTIGSDSRWRSRQCGSTQPRGELLAAGPVSDFKAEGDKCAFKVTGGVAVHLVRTSDNSVSEGKVLTLATEAPTPVKFTLDVAVHADGDGATCQVGCDADLNPFTKMMVEPALTGLFGQMAATLKGRY